MGVFIIEIFFIAIVGGFCWIFDIGCDWFFFFGWDRFGLGCSGIGDLVGFGLGDLVLLKKINFIYIYELIR